MESVKRIVVKRVDGIYVNLRYEPVKSIKAAARFNDIDEYEAFMRGHYRPEHPELYLPQPIQITYEELNEHVQQEREHCELSQSAGGLQQ